ncbi:MAG: sugar phosphate isomerase/epimerase [Acidobacteria bacterium]|nr:sugar phosphate isomerase/epimerase [Acidobacteriota bacterium]
MNAATHRREFLKLPLGAGALCAASFAQPRVARLAGSRVKLALNAYSFDRPLRDGAMTLADVVDYCAQHGIGALDATGYYFPGYPKVPDDESVYRLKKRAFVSGVAIAGTGVRNEFAVPDAAARKADVQLVKDWIEVARKLGGSLIRVFSGRGVPDGTSFEQALNWMAPDLRECAEYGKRHGVIVGLQNHNDFVKTAEQTIRIVQAVDSEWFGVVLDVGSLRQGDPYAQIEKLLPYAVSWQLKETVWYGDKETPIDLPRVKAIIDKVGYRGNLPIETLGAGDPRVKVARFLEQVRSVFPA